jgi:replicative DNA helicase
MNDLRGSGAIAQDASVIIMMWRKDPLVHFFIAKNRSGVTGNLQLKFEGKLYRFFETKAD